METLWQDAGLRADVVVIDDEESIREGCRQALEMEGYRALLANDGRAGLSMVERSHPRVVLLDLRMPGLSGVEVLERLSGIDPRIVPIVITGYGSIDTAVQSMKFGAFDFITKPFDMDKLIDVVQRALRSYADGTSAAAKPPVIEAKRTPAADSNATEPDVLMRGLEALSAYYDLDTRDHTLGEALRSLEDEARYHARKTGRSQECKEAVRTLTADLKLVDTILEKHEFKKNALIQILLDIQSEKRWLPRHVLTWVSRRLNLPLARIYEIATFYEALSLEPRGAHTVQVCLGTACHVRRGPALATTVSSVLGIEPGQTDPDMKFTFEQVHCLGCCALAPVMKVDDAYYGNPSLEELEEIFATHGGKENGK